MPLNNSDMQSGPRSAGVSGSCVNAETMKSYPTLDPSVLDVTRSGHRKKCIAIKSPQGLAQKPFGTDEKKTLSSAPRLY